LVEKLTSEEYELVGRVLGSPLAVDWPRAWADVAEHRLELAAAHLVVALALQGTGRRGLGGPEKRSVISRAYYAMFCAGRAALALETSGDVNDHQGVASRLNKTTSLGPTPNREAVVAALNKYRALRNEADYSAYYPAPLGRDARAAIAAARKVLRICKGWVKTTRKARGIS
jgi:uncharacterized protein (UPF0332 family)